MLTPSPTLRLITSTTRPAAKGEVMRPFEVQGEQWGRDAAVWAHEMESQMQPLFDRTLAALGPRSGQQFLDAGCGTGLAASLARARGASVAGIDASPAFVQFASARTPDAEFRVGDIEELLFEDGAFDFVTAFNSVQYVTAPSVAFGELARVCKPGGNVAIGLWGDPLQCETEALFGRLRSLAPPPPGTPAPLGISEPGRVEAPLEAAQLSVSEGGEVSCPFSFRDIDHAWTAHSSAGPFQKVIDLVGVDKVRDTVANVLEADRKPDGEFRQDNIFRYVIATKPTDAV